MRLTLRTLLAYLDDVLGPTETKEIGQKINESQVASTLVSRIREVMRRRRLTAPELTGPGSGVDPNIVAEYLDNTLPPDRVADLEKVCLESDVHLAEVAACHQILTLVLGEPVEVSPDMRERLYALGPVARESQLVTAAAEPVMSPGNGKPIAAAAVAAPVAAARPFEQTIPDYLKPRPWSHRILPIAAFVVIAAVWIGMVLIDRDYLPHFSDKSTTNETAPADEGRQAAAVDQANSQPSETVAEPGSETQSREATPERTAVPPVAPATTEPTPSVAADAAAVANSTKPAATTEPDKVALNTPQVPPGEPKVVPEPVPAKPKAEEPPPKLAPAQPLPVQYTSPEGVLLRFDPQERQWFMLPHRSTVHADELLAAPEPFEAAFDLEKGRCQITLLGDTVVQMLGKNEAAPVGIEVPQGRVIVQSRGASDDQPVLLSLALPGQMWRLELLTPDTLCGIEVPTREPIGFEQLPTTGPTGGLYVASGSVRLAKRLDDERPQVTVIDKGNWLTLSVEHEEGTGQMSAPMTAPPEWLDPQRRRTTSTLRRFANLFEKEFELGKPISLSIVALVKNQQPKISELAVRCLALTDQYGGVVMALTQSEHEEARMAAVTGLRAWLTKSPDNAKLLRTELENYLPRQTAETVYRLLWGYRQEDAYDYATSRQLVEWLNSDFVVIRELAFYNIFRLTGRRYDYRALSPQSQRQAAVNRWLNHIEKENGLLKRE